MIEIGPYPKNNNVRWINEYMDVIIIISVHKSKYFPFHLFSYVGPVVINGFL